MQYSEIKTSANLDSWINYYWVLNFENRTQLEFKVLPHGCPEILFTLSGQVTLKDHENILLPDAIFVGNRKKAMNIECTPNTKLLGIRFNPFTLINKAICGEEKIIDIRNRIYRIDIQTDVFEYLVKGPVHTDDYKTALDNLGEYFVIKQNHFNHHINNLRDNAHRTPIKIKDLLSKSYVCERQLEIIFKKNFGITPKEFIRISRFLKVINVINNTSFDTIALTIKENGYYDQSHFCKEFKKIVGLSCKEYLSKNKLVKGKSTILI